jgi:hypothetical protein
MFPVKCKDLLPLDHVIIKSVAVRGRLGPLTVWVSNDEELQPGQTDYLFKLHPKFWTKVYERTLPASRYTLKELIFDTPIRLKPGQVKSIYIHSTLPGDEAIVYDNSSYGATAKRYEDDKMVILSGRAHVSNTTFGQEPIWGWGNAWRDRREFVGRINYGAVYKLWNTDVQPKFGSKFQDGARTLFLCQRRWESPCSMLPDECIYYILNMCRWDWFHDTAVDMKARRKREKAWVRAALEEQMASAVAAASTVDASVESVNATDRPCTSGCKTTGLDEADNADDDRMEEDEENDNDDEEEWQEAGDDDEDDYDESDDEADGSEDEDQYHRANVNAFTYRDVDSDAEEEVEDAEDDQATSRREWIRRQFARIHVLRALASMEDTAVVDHVQF